MADFNDFGLILQEFDQINLFWRCSSPLRTRALGEKFKFSVLSFLKY